jgi:PadR family transcriptional regulator PadR
MPDHLGEFEQLVLLALLRLDRSGYGVTVRQELQQRARRSVSLGTVYKTLLRLEAKGLVAAHLGDPTPERGGRRKKYYVVSLAGRRALDHSLTALRKLSHGLATALEAP